MTGAAVLVALVVTVVLLPLITRLAHRIGAVATPRSDRWNRRAVPILGGLAIAVGVVAGSFLLDMPLVDRVALLAGIGAMVALGLADDIAFVPPQWRILIEATVGAAFAAGVTGELAPPIRLGAIPVAAPCVPVAIHATNLL